GVDSNRAVVAGVYIVDGDRFELFTAADGSVLLRHGRGRGLSERLHGDRTLDSVTFASACMGDRLDDQPDRRGHFAASGRANTGALRLAGVVLSVLGLRSGFGSGLVRVVPRLANREGRRHCSGAAGPRRRAAWPSWRRPVGAGSAQRHDLADCGHWRLLCLRARVLSILAADVSGQRSRIHGSCARAVVVAVYRRRLREWY